MVRGKLTIAAIQCATGDDKTANMAWVEERIDDAAFRGADVIALPETFNCIGQNKGEGGPRNEEIPGYSTERLMKKAARHGVYIHGGSIMETIPGEDRAYNTTVFINRSGKIIAKYSKLHTFDIDMPDGARARESDEVRPGGEIVLVKTELATFGLSICYDLRFTEVYRLMALGGADILMVPANFTMVTGKDHWEALLRARAIENTCYVVAPGQYGVKPVGPVAFGNSLVVDPWGTVIARGQERPGVVMAEIDLDYLDECRRRIPSLANRRSDIYSLSSEHIKIYEDM